jgi:hypothetical protein
MFIWRHRTDSVIMGQAVNVMLQTAYFSRSYVRIHCVWIDCGSIISCESAAITTTIKRPLRLERCFDALCAND